MTPKPGSQQRASRPFLILTPGRAGSEFLMHLLNGVPGVLCGPESMRYLRGEAQLQFLTGLPSRAIDLAQPQLGRHYKDRLNPNAHYDAIGFKSKLRDIDFPMRFKKLLEHQQYKVIRLTRSNVVAGAVSILTGMKINQEREGYWHINSDEQRVTQITPTPNVFVSTLYGFAVEQAAIERYFDSLACHKFSITYEQLLEDKSGKIEELLAFLGIHASRAFIERIAVPIKRNTQGKLSQVLTNFRELRDQFINTPYFDAFGAP